MSLGILILVAVKWPVRLRLAREGQPASNISGRFPLTTLRKNLVVFGMVMPLRTSMLLTL